MSSVDSSDPQRRWPGRVVALLALAGASSWIFRYDDAVSDLWWHLAAGREIVSRLAVPVTDPFSYTFAGQPWLNHEWLWQAVYWCAYRLHPDALAWLQVLVIVTLFALLFAGARRDSGSPWAAAAALWIVAATMSWFLDIRPHFVTLAFVAGLMLIRDRSWAPWVWPPLVALWANLHGGFVFGIGVIGLFVLVRSTRESLEQQRVVIDRRALSGVALCLISWIVNPWGWKLAEYPLAYARGTAYSALNEWLPTPFGLDPSTFEGRFWIALLLGVIGAVVGARRRPELAALMLVTTIMSLRSRRFIPLFAISAMPLIALGLAWGGNLIHTRLPALGPVRRRLVERIGIALLLVSSVVLWRGTKLAPDLLERWSSAYLNPVAAVRYLNALGPSRVLNHYSWGGYLLFAGEQQRVFLDERANTIYDDAIFEDYLALVRQRRVPSARFAEQMPDVALGPRQSALVQALTGLPRPWQPVYQDARSVILAPPDSPLLRQRLPDVEQVVGDAPDRIMLRAQLAAQRGDLATAERLAREAIELSPLTLRHYASLALFHASAGKLDAAHRTIESGIAASPRHRSRLRQLEAQVFLTVGEPERALPAMREALARGPMVDRQPQLDQIRQLETRTQR